MREVRRGLQSLWQDRYWLMYDRPPISTWVAGRVALTGDAAHPMLQYLAQGACQALEDAHCLSTMVAKASAEGTLEWPQALREYEQTRTERTARVQASARVWGETWHVDGVARLLRNELFRDRDPDDLRQVDWLYGV